MVCQLIAPPPPSCRLLCPKLFGGLFQSVGQSDPTGWWSKEQITDTRTRSLKVRVALLLLLKFGNQLIHNFHPKGFIARVPKRELHDRGHCHLKRGKLSGHLCLVEGSNPHPLQQVIPLQRIPPIMVDMGKQYLTTCHPIPPLSPTWDEPGLPAASPEGVSAPGRLYRHQDLEKRRHLMSGVTGHGHSYPYALDSRHSTAGIHPITD
jgi:hypothetical protein